MYIRHTHTSRICAHARTYIVVLCSSILTAFSSPLQWTKTGLPSNSYPFDLCTHAVYGMLFSLYGMLFSLYGTLFSLYGTLFSLYGMLFSLYGMRFSLYDMLFSLYCTLFSLYGMLFSLYGMLLLDNFHFQVQYACLLDLLGVGGSVKEMCSFVPDLHSHLCGQNVVLCSLLYYVKCSASLLTMRCTLWGTCVYVDGTSPFHRLSSSVTSMWERQYCPFRRQHSFRVALSVSCTPRCPALLEHWCPSLPKR